MILTINAGLPLFHVYYWVNDTDIDIRQITAALYELGFTDV